MSRPLSPGHMAYLEDCRRQPFYIGSHIKRRQWEDISPYEQATWERNPTPRDWKGKGNG